MLQSPSKLGKMENLQLQDHISLNYHGLGPVEERKEEKGEKVDHIPPPLIKTSSKIFHCSYCKNGIRLKHLFFCLL